ncbi:hypothetical protein BD310DRAFT_929409, partial [Dichomitus squalens]
AWMWKTWASLPARLRDVCATSVPRSLRLLLGCQWPCVDSGLGSLAVVRSSGARSLWSVCCLYHRVRHCCIT